MVTRAILALSALSLAGAATSHHSTAMFELDKTTTIQGTVSKWAFTNPHSWLTLSVKETDGKETPWEFEGGSPSHLARNGWTFRSMKAGDAITVIYSPRVDRKPGGTFRSVIFSDGRRLNSMGSAAAGAAAAPTATTPVAPAATAPAPPASAP